MDDWLSDSEETQSSNYQCQLCSMTFPKKKDLREHAETQHDGKFIQCEQCESKFSTQSALKKHMTYHSDERPFSCELCQKTFKTLNHLKMHAKRTTPCTEDETRLNENRILDDAFEVIEDSSSVQSFQCKLCEKSFTTRQFVRQHVKMVHGEKTFECEECEAKFTSKCSLERHTMSHTGEKPFSCDLCNRSFRLQSQLTRHTQRSKPCNEEDPSETINGKFEMIPSAENDENITFQCKLCAKSFASRQHVRQHVKTVHGERAFKCDQCDARFTSNGSLQKHRISHTDERPFFCGMCDKTFQRFDCLKRHLERSTPCSEDQKKGNKLDEVYEIVATTENPIIVPTSENSESMDAMSLDSIQDIKFHCKLCPKYFSTKQHVRQHVRMVHGEKTFKCDICDAAFTSNGGLTRHKMSHTDERPYVCQICNKGFQRQNQLTNHLNRTTPCDRDPMASNVDEDFGIIPATVNPEDFDATDPKSLENCQFQCKHCPKSFTSKQFVRQHVRNVHGERNFQCDECDAKFTSNGGLQRHKMTHTDERPFSCDLCHKSFGRQSQLKKHLQRTTPCNIDPDLKALHEGFQKIPAIVTSENSPAPEPVQSSLFQCILCLKSFKSKLLIRQHMKIVHGERKYNCDQCDASFTSNGSLQKHYLSHTDERPYSCELCHASFKNMITLRSHLKRSTPCVQDPLDAPEEDFKMFPFKMFPIKEKPENLDITDSNPILNAYFQCKLCPKSFSSKQFVKQHLKQVHGEKAFQCDQCDAKFTTNGCLTRHKMSHTDERPFSCDLCHKTFGRQSQLRNHLQRSTPCNLDPTDNTNEDFEIVMTAENPENSDMTDLKPILISSFQCRFCPKSFTSKEFVKQHSKLVHGERSFKCDQCDASFTTKGALVKHNFSHSDERPFTCELCNASFKSLATLNGHLKRSTPCVQDPLDTPNEDFEIIIATENFENNDMPDSKPMPSFHFQCKLCPKSFSDKQYVKQHVRNVHGEKTFHCDECDSKFTSNGALSRHKMTHTDERPFSCELCHKSFKKEGQLRYHLDRPTPCIKDKMSDFPIISAPEDQTNPQATDFNPTQSFRLKCKLCSKSFQGKQFVRAHMKLVHGERLYKCDQCKAKFTTNSGLARHKLSHSAEKPFSCEFCHKPFQQLRLLKRHMKRSTPCVDSMKAMNKMYGTDLSAFENHQNLPIIPATNDTEESSETVENPSEFDNMVMIKEEPMEISYEEDSVEYDATLTPKQELNETGYSDNSLPETKFDFKVEFQAE